MMSEYQCLMTAVLAVTSRQRALASSPHSALPFPFLSCDELGVMHACGGQK
jgi:hypothetical protein